MLELTETTKRLPRNRRVLVSTTSTQQPPPPEDSLLFLSKPTGWVIETVSAQVELIITTIFSISSTFLSLLHHSKTSVEETPSRVVNQSGTLLRRLGSGVHAVAYVCFVLFSVFIVAAVLGVAVVRAWVEEPVSLNRQLYFDYTDVNPSAVVELGGDGWKGKVVPVGHTFEVSMSMLLPESDFNREIGIFQVNAEVIGSTGEILVKSSQPCMLRFRSLPVRLIRTFTMAVPLMIGISCETQRITVGLLKHKETNTPRRTEGIRITLKPRAGTLDLPQLYQADLQMTSQLPWRKEMIYKWKWTFYVWTILYLYAMLLILVLCCFKPFKLYRRQATRPTELVDVEEEREVSDEFAEAMRKWRARSRRKRKSATSAYTRLLTEEEGSASSEVGGEERRVVVVDDHGEFPTASESSECIGGLMFSFG